MIHLLIVLAATVGIATCCTAAVRPPAVAGMFYESSPFALDRQIETLLKKAPLTTPSGMLMAAVVPHAGYVFSGQCAASLYSLVVSGQYDRVFILCPAHHVALRGVSLPAPSLSAYATPLGNVTIDQAACEALRQQKGFVTSPAAEINEHAIEVQLPFLQKTARTFKLVPLICGAIDPADIDAISDALIPYLDGRTLVMASSDFTHYGPNYQFTPFTENAMPRLQQWLSEASSQIAALDYSGFNKHCMATHDTICGEIPIKILMNTLRRSGMSLSGKVTNMATSGEITRNHENSVFYAAIAFFTKAPPSTGVKHQTRISEGTSVKEHRSGTWSPGLSDTEKTTLFAIARDTLKWCVAGGRGRFDFAPYTITPLMKTNMATFVTLKIHRQLRGCIGSLTPVSALYMSVHENAVNAAMRDPRFSPVASNELSGITVDVSVLSPITDIDSPAAFKIGQQGIILEKGFHRAVYLPEVATEQGWSVEETLSSLSIKAGLDPDAWKAGATFKVFESVVLSE